MKAARLAVSAEDKRAECLDDADDPKAPVLMQDNAEAPYAS